MAIDFELGSSQYIDLNITALNTIAPMTISLWWTPESHTATRAFMGVRGTGNLRGWQLGWAGGGNLNYTQFSQWGDNSDPWTPTDGIRYHVVLVYDQINTAYFIDTVSKGGNAQNTAPGVPADNPDIFIAARNDFGTPQATQDGLLEEFAIWDTALSVAEVAQLYSGGTPIHRMPLTIKPANLVGYWPMNDATDGVIATTVRDWSSSGFDGTPVANPVGAATAVASMAQIIPPVYPLAAAVNRRRRVLICGRAA